MNTETIALKCEAYNSRHGTEYTPETYKEDAARVPCVRSWDEGWDDGSRDFQKLLELARTLAEYVEPEIWAGLAPQDALDELDAYLENAKGETQPPAK